MYKSRYDHKDAYLRDDDIRAPLRQPAVASLAVADKKRRLEPLEARALALLKNLPAPAKLSYCVENFPHLVNRIAMLWLDTNALIIYIDSLMLNDRADRVGFPFEALSELTELREARLRQLTAKRSQ
jgi:hypothetical protein